ncbi:MAG: PilN domain-containing protein [bacterium]
MVGIIFIILLFGAGIFASGRCKSRVSNLQRQLTEIKKQIDSSKVTISEIDKLKKDKKDLEQKLGLIADMKAKQKGPITILQGISQSIPEKVWLTSLISRSNQITMEGMSLTATSIAQFMKNLESIAMLSQIELDRVSQAASDKQKIKQFKITCHLTQSVPDQGQKGES